MTIKSTKRFQKLLLKIPAVSITPVTISMPISIYYIEGIFNREYILLVAWQQDTHRFHYH